MSYANKQQTEIYVVTTSQVQESLLATLLSFGTFNPLFVNCIVGLWLEATCGSVNFFQIHFQRVIVSFFLLNLEFFILTCSSKSLNCIYLACMVLSEKHATCTNSKFNKKSCNAIPMLSSQCVNPEFLSEYKLGKIDGQE